MRIIRSSDYRRMAWKNGGGETIEVAVSPEGAPLDRFDWRVSMAHVARPGPFSIFAGVDRTLAVIAGAGIVLRLAGRGLVRLDADAAPFAFPADEPVDAELVDGAIDDLNVMTRRGRFRHLVSRLSLTAATVLQRRGETTIVVAMRPAATIDAGGGEHRLAARDAVVLDRRDASGIRIVPRAKAELFAIDLWPG